MQDGDVPWISFLRGEKTEDARSRTVDDKYWQITAKDGETPPTTVCYTAG
jgi:hypothetical protein